MSLPALTSSLVRLSTWSGKSSTAWKHHAVRALAFNHFTLRVTRKQDQTWCMREKSASNIATVYIMGNFQAHFCNYFQRNNSWKYRIRTGPVWWVSTSRKPVILYTTSTETGLLVLPQFHYHWDRTTGTATVPLSLRQDYWYCHRTTNTETGPFAVWDGTRQHHKYLHISKLLMARYQLHTFAISAEYMPWNSNCQTFGIS